MPDEPDLPDYDEPVSLYEEGKTPEEVIRKLLQSKQPENPENED